MTFEVRVHPKFLECVPVDRREKIKKALIDLENPLPGGNKKEIKGNMRTYYRLRVGEYRIIYRIDFSLNRVLVFDILTAEQAHKKYNRFI